jgi:uncharacterized protein YjaG (DUF416 family)
MAPNFALFCDAVKHPGADVFRNALNLVWEYASGRTAAINFSLQQEKLEACIPSPEDFDIYGVRPAVDACAGLTLLLQACEVLQDDDFQTLAKLSTGTIEEYLEATDYDGELADHPLLARQQQLVDLLLAQQDLPAHAAADRRSRVDRVRELGCDNGLSNIGISLA